MMKYGNYSIDNMYLCQQNSGDYNNYFFENNFCKKILNLNNYFLTIR